MSEQENATGSVSAEAGWLQLADARWSVLAKALGIALQPVGSHRQNNRFCEHNSVYADNIARIPNEAKSQLCRRDANTIVAADPFAPSLDRPGGSLAWDAAFGLDIVHPEFKTAIARREVRSYLNCNSEWLQQILPSLGRCGPLGPCQTIIRPRGPMIIDFSAMPNGWALVQAAHALAHHRCDCGAMAKWDPAESESPPRPEFHQVVAEMAVGLAFGLPIDVGPRDPHRRTHAHMHYGIDVQATTRVLAPRVCMPWTAPGGPVFDRTLIVVSVALLLGPPPAVWKHGGDKTTARDAWAGIPSMAVITGFAPVEVLAHGPLVTWRTTPDDCVVASMLCAEDLLPASLLHGHIELGRLRGAMREQGSFVNVGEWLASDQLAALLAQTPPFPCRFCMQFDRDCVDAPREPSIHTCWVDRAGRRRHSAKAELSAEWASYMRNIREITRILDSGTIECEAGQSGSRKEIVQIRRDRKNASKRKIASLYLKEDIKMVRERVISGRQLTRHDKAILKEHETTMREMTHE